MRYFNARARRLSHERDLNGLIRRLTIKRFGPTGFRVSERRSRDHPAISKSTGRAADIVLGPSLAGRTGNRCPHRALQGSG